MAGTPPRAGRRGATRSAPAAPRWRPGGPRSPRGRPLPPAVAGHARRRRPPSTDGGDRVAVQGVEPVLDRGDPCGQTVDVGRGGAPGRGPTTSARPPARSGPSVGTVPPAIDRPTLREHLGPAGLALARRPGQPDRERVRRAGGQGVERGLGVARLVRAQPLGTGAHLRGGLRAPQEQDGEGRLLQRLEAPALVRLVAVAGGAGPGAGVDEPHEPLRLERQQRVLDRPVVVRHDRVPVRRLVAGEAEAVEGQRVRVRNRRLLLDQAGEHPPLDRRQLHAADFTAGPGPSRHQAEKPLGRGGVERRAGRSRRGGGTCR